MSDGLSRRALRVRRTSSSSPVPRRLAERDVHVVAVAQGDRAGLARAAARVEVTAGLEAVPGRVDLVVPDDVHDPHPARERVGVADLVVGERLGDEGLGGRLVVEVGRVERPVEGAAVLVLGLATGSAAAQRAAVAATTSREPLTEGDRARLVLARAPLLRLVRRIRVRRRDVLRRGGHRGQAGQQRSRQHHHDSLAHAQEASGADGTAEYKWDKKSLVHRRVGWTRREHLAEAPVDRRVLVVAEAGDDHVAGRLVERDRLRLHEARSPGSSPPRRRRGRSPPGARASPAPTRDRVRTGRRTSV